MRFLDAIFPWLIAVSTLIDGIAAVSVLAISGRATAGGTPAPVGLVRILAAAAAAFVAFVLKIPVFTRVGLTAFGALHLLYVDATVMVPAIGLGLLVASSPRLTGCKIPATPLARVVAFLSLVPAPVALYATWIEPFRLQVERASLALPTERQGARTVRIGVLADLQTDHVGKYERDAVARLMAEKPDVIVVPGDLFQGSPAEFEANRDALRDLLSRLSAPGGVYFVMGDFDEGRAETISLLRSTEITLLVDDFVQVTVGDRVVTIGGVELNVTSPRALATVRRLESDPGLGDVRIIVAHRPDVALQLRPQSRIDLAIAGHTHGGQVVVPGYGPPVTLTDVPREVAAGGLHALKGNSVYVSRGVGCERGQAPRIRLFCPPEVSVVALESPSARPPASNTEAPVTPTPGRMHEAAGAALPAPAQTRAP